MYTCILELDYNCLSICTKITTSAALYSYFICWGLRVDSNDLENWIAMTMSFDVGIESSLWVLIAQWENKIKNFSLFAQIIVW